MNDRLGGSRRSSPVSDRYMRSRWEGFLSQDERGMLLIEGVPVDRIARKYGTPLYIMVESEIRRNFRRFRKTFGKDVVLQYAVKCQSNLEVLRIAREEGFELDCSSVGELILGLLADLDPRQLTLTNLYKTEQDLHFAAKIGVQSVTADSLEELENIARTARKLRTQVRTVIRVNPLITVGRYTTKGNKYGIPLPDVEAAVRFAASSPYVDVRGLHFMGGYVHSVKVYKEAAKTMVALAARCERIKGVKMRTLSLGGGFPVSIGEEKSFPIEDMAGFTDFYKKLCRTHGVPHLQLILEPGKSIVMNACVSLMRVIANKKIHRDLRMLIVDGSTYNVVPDALIQTQLAYDVLPASAMSAPRTETVDIAGNTCDAWDVISRGRGMPRLEADDLVAVMDTGAYAQVMASNFNTIKRPAMIMIAPDGSIRQIRRKDRYSEMFAPELDVLKMADPNELERYHNLYRVNIDRIWKDGQGRSARRLPVKRTPARRDPARIARSAGTRKTPAIARARKKNLSASKKRSA